MRISWVIVSTFAGLSLTAQQPLSVPKEEALGRHLADELRKQTKPLGSLAAQNYVERLGERITAHAPDIRSALTFSVIADDPCRAVHEPVALPGGYCFVPAALFLAAQDEAEFTGMLAHAIGHIALPHGFRPAAQGPIVNYSSIPLIFMGGLSSCSESQAMPVAFAAATRNAELEADSWAAQTLARAGVDPNALVRYLGRVQAKPASPGTSLLPSADQRIAALLPVLTKLPVSGSAPAHTPEFAAVQQEVRGLAEVQRRHTPPSLVRKPR